MKKLLALILALVMLLSFAACGEDKSAKDDNDGDSKPKTSSVEDKGDDTSSEEEVKPVIAKEGTLKDDVYTNQSIGIKINKPEGWKVAPRENLSTMNGETASFEAAEENWYDYMAANEASEMLFLTFEKTKQSATEYLEENKKEAIEEAEDDMMTIDSCKIVDKTIAGKTVKCLEVIYSEEDGKSVVMAAFEADNDALVVIALLCTESGPDAVLKNIVAA